jgi:hypothetical protein
MMKKTLALAIFFGITVPLSALADDSLVRFDGAIGVNPVKSGPAANVVLGVNPGGAPWVIKDLSASIRSDGRITVNGRGLLLGGTDNIGRTNGNSVRARLFCGGNAAPSFDSNPLGVPLEADGDFHISDVLSNLPLPSPCANAVLLIVSATNGNWFAAGIPKQGR